MICPRCSGSTVYRDENGIPQPCCRTGIAPTGPCSPESAVGCSTVPDGYDAQTYALTRDPPWQRHPLCAPSAPELGPSGMTGREAVDRVTRAVRAADKEFQQAGGSSRHWVRDHFLPHLEAEGLAFVAIAAKPEPRLVLTPAGEAALAKAKELKR